MARMADVRAQYAQSMVTTTPERIVTMLYDRLVRDLVSAEQSIVDRDIEASNRELQHAQQILIELQHALDTKSWGAADGLSALYTFLIQQLLQANVRKDAEQVRRSRELIEPIAEAWHQAAGRVAAPGRADAPRLSGSIGAAV